MRIGICLFLLLSVRSYSQGCSDAGFCSLGALKDVQSGKTANRVLDIGSSLGIGEENTFTVNPYLQYSHRLNKSFTIQAKITATYASGFLGSVFNAGDFYGFTTYTFQQKGKSALRLVGGVKIPFTSSNDKNAAGRPLPMDYQSSIGTYDFIAGINFVYEDTWEIDGGVQLPVIQMNKSSFFPEEYTESRALSFPPTNLFERKPDVLLRAGYYIRLSKSIVVKPNLLAIYHLGEDTYENRFGNRVSLEGSRGVTINGALIASKKLKNNNRLEVAFATPFVVRDIRPDGLTRAAVFSIQYSIGL